jgi:MFS family permease
VHASPPRTLAVGLFLAVSLAASETIAVSTALPTIADELDGEALYGAVFAANMLANLLGIVAAGQAADRSGPARPFALAVAVFLVGLTVAGTAPTMLAVVAGRALQGLGIGGIAALSYVVVRRAFPEDRQPRMFAIMSAAWVLPALVAPLLAGWVTEAASWRWVFLGIIPLVAAAGIAILPHLRRLGPDAHADGPDRIGPALVLTAGAGIALAGFTLAGRPLLAVPLVVAGVAIALPPLGRLMPPGTVRARPGRPAAVATRACATAAFLGIDAFVPLAADRIHDARPVVQGLVILGGAVAWTGGQAIAARRHGRVAPRRLAVSGMSLLALGGVLTIPVVVAGWPLWLTFTTWCIGGFGMGLLFNPTSMVAMGTAGTGEAGLASSQINVADSLGFASMGAIGGAVVAVTEGSSIATGLTVVFASAIAVAAIGILAARNLPATALSP